MNIKGYQPKIIEGRIKGTGWPIDGHTIILSLWNYDNYKNWHLYDWGNQSDDAMMRTMFITETEAGMCLYDTLEEFSEHWKEWEAQGSFCIPVENVEIVKIIREEVKE